MTVEAALNELESLLPGLNYVVSFDLHRVPVIPGGKPDQYVHVALGAKAIVGGYVDTTVHDMLTEVERCIRWEGDRGSHPDAVAVRSPRLDDLLNVVLTHLRIVAERATAIWSFWLKVGHPHYPVQWDFAYVLAGPNNAEVIIGSSSD